METVQVKVCQLCLRTDVKMYEVNYPFKYYMDVVIPVSPCIKSLPPYVCYECKALVVKYYFFKERCSRGQTALYNMISSSGQILIDKLTQTRHQLQLNLNLATFNISTASISIHEGQSWLDIKSTPIERSVEANISEDIVKEEEGDYMHPTSPMASTDPLSTDMKIKEESTGDSEEQEVVNEDRTANVLNVAESLTPIKLHPVHNITQAKIKVSDLSSQCIEKMFMNKETYKKELNFTVSKNVEDMSKQKDKKQKNKNVGAVPGVKDYTESKRLRDIRLIKHNSKRAECTTMNKETEGTVLDKYKRTYTKQEEEEDRTTRTSNKESIQEKRKEHGTINIEGPTYVEHYDASKIKKRKNDAEGSHENKKNKRIHTENNRFVCEICQRKFTQKVSLNRHFIMHTGENPFACEICQQKFKRKERLIIHLRTHTGEKPFVCDICKVRFNQKASLNRHFKTHTGEKPFECHICKRRFIRKMDLNTHFITHTGDKPFECNICQKRFSLKTKLNKHLKRMHTKEKS